MTAVQPPPYSPLASFIQEIGQRARHYDLPEELVAVHALALVSTLAGARIQCHRPDGTKVRPLLPLVIASPDPLLPAWMGSEWDELERRVPSTRCRLAAIAADPHVIAAKRHRKRLLQQLDPSGELLLQRIDRLFSGPPPPRRFGSVRRYGKTGGRPEIAVHSLTHLAAGLSQVDRACREIPVAEKRLAACESLIFWLGGGDLQKLARADGPVMLARLGPLVMVDRPSVPASDPPESLTAFLMHLLLAHGFDQPPARFRPSAALAALLDEHERELRQLAEALPPCLREVPIITDLAWQYAALLHAVCRGDGQASTETTDVHVAALAMSLAKWLTCCHLSAIRQCLPADDEGLFGERERQVLRVLGRSPANFRNLQRSLRGVRKAELLPILQRAVRAGLAQETADGWSAAALPVIRLSEKSPVKAATPPCQAATPPPGPDVPDELAGDNPRAA